MVMGQKDIIQEYVQNNNKDINDYTVLVDIIFWGLLAYVYLNGSVDLYKITFQYSIVFIILRFLINKMTQLGYYQINITQGLFTILIILLIQNELINVYIGWGMIFAYSLLVISVKYSYSSDSLFTFLLAMNIILFKELVMSKSQINV